MDTLAIDKLTLSPSRPDGFVPRPTPWLLDRMRDYGPIEPVVVRPLGTGKFEILTNPETWRAAGELGYHSVPVVVRDDLDDLEAADVVQDHYGPRQQNAIDEANYFESELELLGGRSRRGAITELAEKFRLARPYVAHSLRLLTLPVRIQALIADGSLSPGQARPLVTIPGRSDQLRAANQIVRDKLSARDAEVLAKNFRAGTPVPQFAQEPVAPTQKDPDILRLEKKVSEMIGTEFTIEGGRAVINYHSDYDILGGILARLGYKE